MRGTLSLSTLRLCRRRLHVEQLQALHFAGGPFRQSCHEPQLAWSFVASKLRLTMGAQLRHVAARAGLEDDASEDVLPIELVRNADCRRLENGGMLEKRLVDLARGDVLATLDDQLLQAAGNEIETVGVAISQISRREPAVRGERLRGKFGRPVVAEH